MEQNKTVNKLWYTLGTVAATWMLLIFATACGDNKSNNTPAPVAPCATPNCYTYPNGTGIVNGYNGFVSQSQNLYNSYYNYGAYNVSGSLTAQTGYKQMLKESMGVCDRDYSNGGLSGCDAWVQGYQKIVIEMQGTTSSQVRLSIYGYPYISNNYWYQYSLPSPVDFFLGMVGFPVPSMAGGYFNPMILNATVHPINNSAGFEIRAYGPAGSYGYNKLIQLQVANGKFEDPSFNYVIHYNGQQAASGTFARCQTAGCAY